MKRNIAANAAVMPSFPARYVARLNHDPGVAKALARQEAPPSHREENMVARRPRRSRPRERNHFRGVEVSH